MDRTYREKPTWKSRVPATASTDVSKRGPDELKAVPQPGTTSPLFSLYRRSSLYGMR